MAVSRAQAIELFEKGPTGVDTKIWFAKEMEKINAGKGNLAESETAEDTDESQDAVEIFELPPSDSNDAADKKVAEPSKDAGAADDQDKPKDKKDDEPVDPVMARLELMERELERERLRREKLELENEKNAERARRYAGEIGNLKNPSRKKAEPVQDQQTDLLDDDAGDKPRPRIQPEVQMLLEDVQERADQIFWEVLDDFQSKNKDAANYAEEMAKISQIKAQEYAADLASPSLKTRRRASEMLIRECYLQAKQDAMDRDYAEFKSKHEERIKDLNERKRGASAAGGSDAQASNDRPSAKKTLKDLSDDELRALIRKQSGR